MDFSADDLRKQSTAYLKPSLPESELAIVVSGRQKPVLRNLGNGLLVAYIIDRGDDFQYVQRRHLEEAGVTDGELHQYAVGNLAELTRTRLKVELCGSVFAALMGGNFEASLILVDSLWNETLARLITKEFVATVPARDILAFCDIGSAQGLAQLRQISAVTTEGGDHLLTPGLYHRQDHAWVPFSD
jgi:hypothetical protein